jgi:hypothetical protein
MKSYNVVRQVIFNEVIQVTAEDEYEAIKIAESTPVEGDLDFVETKNYYAEEF